MSEQLQAALTKVLEGLLATAEKATDVGSEQLPFVIHEYLAWGLWSHSISLGVWLVVAASLYTTAVSLRRSVKEYDTFDDVPHKLETAWIMGHYVLPCLGIFAAAFALAVHANAIVKILVAPRVYLIDALRGML